MHKLSWDKLCIITPRLWAARALSMRKLHKKRGGFYLPSFWALEMLMQEFLIGNLKCFCIIVRNTLIKSCQILDNVAAVTNFTGNVWCINVRLLADKNYMSRTILNFRIVQAENTIILIVSFFLEFIRSCGNENGKIFIYIMNYRKVK